MDDNANHNPYQMTSQEPTDIGKNAPISLPPSPANKPDGFDRTLKIFKDGMLIGSYPADKLKVTEITALAIDQGILYIADGPGAQVASFRTRPPAEGAK